MDLLLIAVLVVGFPGAPADTDAGLAVMQSALREVVDADANAKVVVQSSKASLPHAAWEATVTWKGLQVSIELQYERKPVATQTLVFSPTDAPHEMARSVGLALGAMVNREQVVAHPPSIANSQRAAWWIQAGSLGEAALVDEPVAFGAAFTLGRRVLDGGTAVVGVGAATWGNLAAAEASFWSARAGMGVRQPLWARGWWRLAAQGVFGAAFEQVNHESDDDPAPVRRGRWLPRADVGVSNSFVITNIWQGFVDLGVGVLAGTTNIEVNGATQASLSAVRAVAAVGVRCDL